MTSITFTFYSKKPPTIDNIFISLNLLPLKIVNVIDATYLDIRSTHGRVWPVERKRATGMAASSNICSIERPRTCESQFAHMQILARPRKRKCTVTAGTGHSF